MQTVMRGAEARLVEMLNELSDRPDGWHLILFHLSDLLEEYKSEYQVRIAVNMINDLLRAAEGGIYVCMDGSIAVLCRDISHQLRNKLIFQLRYLYMDDPLAYGTDGSENEQFCTSYNLEADIRACIQLFTRRMTAHLRPQRAAAPAVSAPASNVIMLDAPSPAMPALSSAPHFSAQRLAGFERDLAALDLSRAVRRQAICAFNAAGQGQRVFDELYIHMPHLRELLKSDVDFLSNKWLFKYLTQLLDRKVLEMIGSEAPKHLAQPLSINVNVETLLSDAFSMFDAALPAHLKVAVVFEIHAVDLFADTAAFVFACAQAQKSGYRVCLDGLTDIGFLQIDRERIGADLVKLQWNADFAADIQKKENRQLKDAVKKCGANRIILCRCDTREAVEYGRALGISLFQGRYLDQLLNPQAKVTN